MTTNSTLFESYSTVPKEWIDNNGHMHDANYLDAFNLGVGDFLDSLDMGWAYRERTCCSYFNLAQNLDYYRELFEDEPFRITLQLVDWDYKKLHLFMYLYHAEKGYLCAANERVQIHVDLNTRKSTPFPEEIKQRLEDFYKSQTVVETPKELGRKLGIRRKR